MTLFCEGPACCHVVLACVLSPGMVLCYLLSIVHSITRLLKLVMCNKIQCEGREDDWTENFVYKDMIGVCSWIVTDLQRAPA